jgi:hypothetical protein
MYGFLGTGLGERDFVGMYGFPGTGLRVGQVGAGLPGSGRSIEVGGSGFADTGSDARIEVIRLNLSSLYYLEPVLEDPAGRSGNRTKFGLFSKTPGMRCRF